MNSKKPNRSTIYLTAAVPEYLKREVLRFCEENDTTVSRLIRTSLSKVIFPAGNSGEPANA